MIEFGSHSKETIERYSNIRFKELEGYLSQEDAGRSLADFLRHNITFTVELLFGIKIFPYQEILIQNWFENHYCIVTAARGGAKCIDENEEVLTERGIIKIKDAVVGDKIQAITGTQTILDKWENPEEDGYKVTSYHGMEFTGKVGHKVYTFDNNLCKFSYKNIEELNLEDTLVVRKGPNVWGNGSIVEGFLKVNQHPRIKSINLVENEELYYLLGLILGDGCIRSKRDHMVSITSADPEIIEFVTRKLKEICPENSIVISRKLGNQATDVRVYHKTLVEFLNYVGFNSKDYAHEKRVPEKIKGAKKAYICAFLSGLYDTDGTLKYHIALNKTNSKKIHISLCSASKILIRDVQSLLLNLGILSKRKLVHTGRKGYKIMGKICNTHDAYTLLFGNYENAKIFNDNIGFRLSRKQNILQQYLDNKTLITSYDSNLIKGMGIYLKNKYQVNSFKCRDKNRTVKIHDSLSPSRLKYFAEYAENLDQIDRDLFNYVVNNNLTFTGISEITPVKTKTIDITVDKEECYWSSGFIHHNSYTCAIFCLLYLIFNPGAKIILTSNVFRSSRRLMEQMEQFINAKGAELLKQCYPNEIRRSTDAWRLESNGGFIRALPLNDKIRGERADLLIIDEFLLIPEQIYSSILFPFLTAKNNIQDQLEIDALETSMIKLGKMKEEDRTTLEGDKKIIALTSASFTFEFCYQIHQSWSAKAIRPDPSERQKYFVARLPYLMLPPQLVEETVINEAKSGGENTPYFKREYMAMYISGSDGFFNAKCMNENTALLGDYPWVQLYGERDKEYILAIDPSFSSGKRSDFFAMGLYLLDSAKESLTLVHSYAAAGGDLDSHICYLHYLIKNFNIVLITADLHGGGGENFNFIETANQSLLFKSTGTKIGFFNGSFDENTNDNKLEEYWLMKSSYNQTAMNICYTQRFHSTEWQKRANEYMAHEIQRGRLCFASSLFNNDQIFKTVRDMSLPQNLKDDNNKVYDIGYLAERQDFMIQETKNQIMLIEPRMSITGGITFDLPTAVKSIKGEKRARRDNYTCALMACWAAKFYFAFKNHDTNSEYQEWTPKLIV
jgi:intein/homing endonuclease